MDRSGIGTGKSNWVCNVIRRETDGSLTGTVLDGEGFVSSLLVAGYQVAGKSIYYGRAMLQQQISLMLKYMQHQ